MPFYSMVVASSGDSVPSVDLPPGIAPFVRTPLTSGIIFIGSGVTGAVGYQLEPGAVGNWFPAGDAASNIEFLLLDGLKLKLDGDPVIWG